MKRGETMARKKKEKQEKAVGTPYRFPTVYPGMPIETMQSNTDPLGSYTGNATDGQMPVQDADDL